MATNKPLPQTYRFTASVLHIIYKLQIFQHPIIQTWRSSKLLTKINIGGSWYVLMLVLNHEHTIYRSL